MPFVASALGIGGDGKWWLRLTCCRKPGPLGPVRYNVYGVSCVWAVAPWNAIGCIVKLLLCKIKCHA